MRPSSIFGHGFLPDILATQRAQSETKIIASEIHVKLGPKWDVRAQDIPGRDLKMRKGIHDAGNGNTFAGTELQKGDGGKPAK